MGCVITKNKEHSLVDLQKGRLNFDPEALAGLYKPL